MDLIQSVGDNLCDLLPSLPVIIQACLSTEHS